MSRLAKRQRSSSNDSIQRKRLRDLDSFDLDSEDAADHIKETIRREIDQWYKPSGGPAGSSRIISFDWVRDYLEDGTPRESAGAASRVTSGDRIGDRIGRERGATSGEGGPESSRVEGLRSPASTAPEDDDDEEIAIDPATLEVLRTLEEKPGYGPEDVLFGRGGLSNHHAGNKRYRAEADKLKKEHRDAGTTKGQKTAIRNRLVDIVHGYGGRFLLFDQNSDCWTEVPLRKARRKASQALREDFKKGISAGDMFVASIF